MKKYLVFSILAAMCIPSVACSSRKENSVDMGGARRLQLKNAGKKGTPDAEGPREMPNILPETHYAAGQLFESQGQLDKSIAQYRRAVSVNHNFAAAYHRLGLVLSTTGQHEQAIEAITKAVQIKPDNAVLRNNLGYEFMHEKRWDDAERELRKAIALQPSLARAHVNLGLVMARVQRFDDALAAFMTVLPEADAYYNLGLLYRGQSQYSQAAGAFRKVLSINPDFTAATGQLEQVEMLLESQVAEQRSARFAQANTEPAAIIPASLQDAIDANIAEVGSLIGQVPAEAKEEQITEIRPFDGLTGFVPSMDQLLQIIENEMNCSIDAEYLVDSIDPIETENIDIGMTEFAASHDIDSNISADTGIDSTAPPEVVAVEEVIVMHECDPVVIAQNDTASTPLRMMSEFQLGGTSGANTLAMIVADYPHDVAMPAELPAVQNRPASYYMRAEVSTWFDDFRQLDALVSITTNEVLCLQNVEGEDFALQPTVDDRVGALDHADPLLEAMEAADEDMALARAAAPSNAAR